MLIDIRTLALASVLSSVVFTVTMLTSWRQVPEERSLRDWVMGSILMSMGLLEITLRSWINFRLSIAIGNATIFLGCGSMLIGLRHLLGLKVLSHERGMVWALSGLIFAACLYYTFSVPSLSARISLVSAGLALYHLAVAQAIYQHRETRLKEWLRFTLALQMIGFVLFVARAWMAPSSTVTQSYSQTPNWLIAAPGIYMLCFNLWMSITVVLIVMARMHRKVIETLGLDRVILADSPVAIATYHHLGACIQANQAYARLMDCQREQLLTQNFYALPQWSKSGLLLACQEALQQEQGCSCEIQMMTSSGYLRWLDCRILPSKINDSMHLLIQFFDLTERKRLEDELRQMAFHDALTRLPNRRLLIERIGQAQLNSVRRQTYAALLFIDLDKFKQLNDRFGHHTGDQALVEIAQRLQRATRQNDTVARLGGDEFVVLFGDLADDADTAWQNAQKLAGQLQQLLSQPFVFDQETCPSGASIGIRLIYGNQDSPTQILDDADRAMYQSKSALDNPEHDHR